MKILEKYFLIKSQFYLCLISSFYIPSTAPDFLKSALAARTPPCLRTAPTTEPAPPVSSVTWPLSCRPLTISSASPASCSTTIGLCAQIKLSD